MWSLFLYNMYIAKYTHLKDLVVPTLNEKRATRYMGFYWIYHWEELICKNSNFLSMQHVYNLEIKYFDWLIWLNCNFIAVYNLIQFAAQLLSQWGNWYLMF